MAYKFAPSQEMTTVLGIHVQVGRTGALTPVAQLKPVETGVGSLSAGRPFTIKRKLTERTSGKATMLSFNEQGT